jgi:GT2 family glycosyltransferase
MSSSFESHPPDPLVSIVLLNYNGRRFANLWASVFESAYEPKEIVFVDNGSVDDSMEVFSSLAKRFPSVRSSIVRVEQNVGYSGGNNIGFAHTSGPIVCLLSNDIKVDPGWLLPIVRAFQAQPSVGAAQSAQYQLQRPNERDVPSNVLDPFGFSHSLSGPARDEKIRPVFYTEGAVMFVRRSLVDELGYLFPEDYFMLFEDADFCWRARLRGWKSVVVEESRVYHARGGTEPGIYFRKNAALVSRGTRNRLATLYTNYSLSNALIFLPLTMVLEFVKVLGLAVNGRRRQSTAVLAGARRFMRDRSALRERRQQVQATRRVNDVTIRSEMLDPAEAVARLLDSWHPALKDLDQIERWTSAGAR